MNKRTDIPKLSKFCKFNETAKNSDSVDIALDSSAASLLFNLSKGSAITAAISVSAAAGLLKASIKETPFVDLVCHIENKKSLRIASKLSRSATIRSLLTDIAASVKQDQYRSSQLNATLWRETDLVVSTGKSPIVSGENGPDLLVSLSEFDQTVCVLRISSPSGSLSHWFCRQFGNAISDVIAQFNNTDTKLSNLLMWKSDLDGITKINEAAARDWEPSTVVQMVIRQANENPDAIALRFKNQHITYSSLLDKAQQLSNFLIGRHKVTKGQVVAVKAERHPQTIITLLAVMMAGAVYLPLQSSLPAPRLLKILRESDAALFVHANALPEGFESMPCPIVNLNDFKMQKVVLVTDQSSPSDRAYIIYTSGSTGQPKGIVLHHAGLANTVLDHLEKLSIGPGDVYLQFMSPSFDGFLLDVFKSLASGATLVLIDEETLQDERKLKELVIRWGITLTTMTPSFLSILDDETMSKFDWIVSAGEILPLETAKRLVKLTTLYNGYGPSEATINTTLKRVEQEDIRGTIPIGAPGANKFLQIVGADGVQKPPGVLGEIYIGGVGLAEGYLGNPKWTSQQFCYPIWAKQERFYKTGDYGAWSNDGELLFHGRQDAQVKHRGFRLDLLEVSHSLEGLDGVKRAEAILVEHGGAKILTAFVESSLQNEDILKQLEKTLPHQAVPRYIISILDWPLTETGKIDKQALMSLAIAHRSAQSMPQIEDIPESLQRLWAAALSIEGAEPNADFFSLGGDSIRLIQFVKNARDAGFNLDPQTVLRCRTLARLSDVLHSDPNSGVRPQEISKPHSTPKIAASHISASQMQSYMIDKALSAKSGSGIYLGFAEWKIDETDYDHNAFREALCLLPFYHTCLSWNFRQEAGQNRLVLGPPRQLKVVDQDVSKLSQREIGAVISSEIKRQSIIGFNVFDDDELVRVRLLRQSETASSAFLSFHHALLDGWSGVEIRNDLYDLYNAIKNNAALPAPAEWSEHDYRIFVEEEKKSLAENSPARFFWESEAKRHVTVGANLPSGKYRNFELSIPTEVIRAASHLRKRNEVGIKTVYLSAFMSALALTSTKFSSVAMVVNGRMAALENPMRSTGLFWNIVPLFGCVANNKSLQTLQKSLDDMESYIGFPYAEIEKIAGGTLQLPLFNFVQFHNTSTGARALREGALQSRFHFPATIFLKLPANSDSPGLMKFECEENYLSPEQYFLFRKHFLEYFTGGKRS